MIFCPSFQVKVLFNSVKIQQNFFSFITQKNNGKQLKKIVARAITRAITRANTEHILQDSLFFKKLSQMKGLKCFILKMI